MPSICIFTASRLPEREILTHQARKISQDLAEQGWDLVFGGSDMGLMHVVAEAFHEKGRTVTGIIPHCFDTRCNTFPGATHIIKVNTLRERKQAMEDRSDAFLALTGAMGTLDEFLEILTLKYLGLTSKPLLLFNPENYWGPFVQMLERMNEEGFCAADASELYAAPASPGEVIRMLAALVS